MLVTWSLVLLACATPNPTSCVQRPALATAQDGRKQPWVSYSHSECMIEASRVETLTTMRAWCVRGINRP